MLWPAFDGESAWVSLCGDLGRALETMSTAETRTAVGSGKSRSAQVVFH